MLIIDAHANRSFTVDDEEDPCYASSHPCRGCRSCEYYVQVLRRGISWFPVDHYYVQLKTTDEGCLPTNNGGWRRDWCHVRPEHPCNIDLTRAVTGHPMGEPIVTTPRPFLVLGSAESQRTLSSLPFLVAHPSAVNISPRICSASRFPPRPPSIRRALSILSCAIPHVWERSTSH
jgi:hypothetical protein